MMSNEQLVETIQARNFQTQHVQQYELEEIKIIYKIEDNLKMHKEKMKEKVYNAVLRIQDANKNVKAE